MTTLASWVAETRDYLDGQRPQQGNQLAAPYTAGTGSITLANALGPIGPDSWLSVGTNVLRVMTVNQLTKTATVLGGQRGSTDANAASGALVLVNPRFTDFQIVREINRHLPTMSSPANGLFQVATMIVDYTGSIEGYDMAGVSGLIRVLEVRREVVGPSLAWPALDTTDWDVVRSAPTGFASGTSIRVKAGWTGLDVQVVYAKQFTPISTVLSTDVATTGIPVEMEDIPPMGAALRLMSGREIPRNQDQSQGDTRRANEVPPGAVAASYRGVLGQWQQRVKEESARLRAQYPIQW